VLYNWMDRAFMSLSKAGGPFRAANEMHLVTVRTLINVYSKTRSYVADLFISIGMCPSSRIVFQSLNQISCVTIFHYARNSELGPTKALGAAS
jgi:hypothetical protein